VKTTQGTTKQLIQIHHSSRTHWVGNGFPVRSVFDYNGLGQELSPFLLLDYAAPHDFSPSHERRGVGAHPHKGFETVTVVYQGELEHRDSSGGGGRIGPGDVQWMTAGRGIIHEEFHAPEFTRRGGPMQMVQLWVNLRARDKGAEPGYQTLLNAEIPNVTLSAGAGSVRVIAGEFGETPGVARTFSPINLWDVSLVAGKSAEFSIPVGHTCTFLVLRGEVTVGAGEKASEGDLAIFGRGGDRIVLESPTGAQLLVMTGEPFDEPIVGHGPFVMNTAEEIQEAFEQYQRGEMGTIA
jgi:quercetin 2,3-dioxygenase